jgi:glycosyltransferase involved in cell wall biosynthesis
MKVSIITVCYNSKDFIQHAIDSVLNQTYSNIEYIIIDGNSSDGTVDIINSYGEKISKFVSEKDNGIYDAMNKGLSFVTGDVVGILNSDDFYISNTIISEIVDQFNATVCDALFADLIFVDRNNTDKQVRYWKSKPYISGSFKQGWHPSHPTFFVKNEFYKNFGLFNCSLKLAADFELMLRFIVKHQAKTFYYDKPIVKMRMGGASTKGLSNLVKQNIECVKSFKINGLKVSIFYPIIRLAPKILQVIKRKIT